MENFVTKFDMLPNTLAEQDEVAQQVIEAVLDGEIDPIRLDIYLKSIENTVDKIRKNAQVKEYTIDKAEEYGKSFDMFGANVTVRRRRNFDFKQDSKWADLKKQETEVANKRKIREKLLKAIPDDGEIADPDTGEVIGSLLVSSPAYLVIKFKGKED